MKAYANRSKGSKGPEEWKPPERDYWCQYAIDWVTIKNTWELTANDAEEASLAEMLETCEPAISLNVVTSSGTNAGRNTTRHRGGGRKLRIMRSGRGGR